MCTGRQPSPNRPTGQSTAASMSHSARKRRTSPHRLTQARLPNMFSRGTWILLHWRCHDFVNPRNVRDAEVVACGPALAMGYRLG